VAAAPAPAAAPAAVALQFAVVAPASEVVPAAGNLLLVTPLGLPSSPQGKEQNIFMQIFQIQMILNTRLPLLKIPNLRRSLLNLQKVNPILKAGG
jgi:hypothetical protein